MHFAGRYTITKQKVSGEMLNKQTFLLSCFSMQSELEVMQEQHSRIKENIQNACDEGSRLATQKQDLVRQYEKLKRSIQVMLHTKAGLPLHDSGMQVIW